MIEDFIVFLKKAIQDQRENFINNNLATGNVGKEGYEKSIGIIEALKSTESNLDVWAAQFNKSQGN